MSNSDYANMQDKTLPRIMPRVRVKRFIFYFVQAVGLSGLPKLGRSKVAYDNLESPEVCSAGVLRRSSTQAVNLKDFEKSKGL